MSAAGVDAETVAVEAAAFGSLSFSRSRLSFRKEDGRFLPRHTVGVDPELVGEKAFSHRAVREWWTWLLNGYTPQADTVLVTPCSNVKPYTRSPVSRKVRAILRRNGFWSDTSNRPVGLEWLYLSDLLILVPYWRAEEYPACCYEVPPDLVVSNQKLFSLVAGLLAKAVEGLVVRGLRRVIVFLPRKHLLIWTAARRQARRWPEEVQVRYHILRVRERLEPIVAELAGREA